ncbi:MAG: hypothetical protein J6M31_02205 [Bacteroidales bacterium]|nr:hypothetical protein [Bacteroidales bacterium]
MTRYKLITALLLLVTACGPGKSAGNHGADVSSVRPESIPGNYSMKMVVDGDTRYSTAVVTEMPGGAFQIARITVYGPVNYCFTLGANAAVSSRELGTGSISYQRSIKKTTIRFEKEGALCELSR